MGQNGSNTYASIDELMELGILQEANRRFFHFLGLELVARVEPDGPHSLHIVDGRRKNGGMTFGHWEAGWSEVRRARSEFVAHLLESRVAERRRVGGVGVQPMEEL